MNFWGLFKIFLTEISFFPKIDNFFLLAIFEKKMEKKDYYFFLAFLGDYRWGKDFGAYVVLFYKKNMNCGVCDDTVSMLNFTT
jgi:hypothetical protein